MALKPQGNNILAGTSLAIAQIQSPDYVPGVSGWCIFQNGNAEFNQGTFRGYIIGGSLFIYSGAPALGNPPIAWMSSASTDPSGNTLTPASHVVVGAGQDGSPQVVLESSAGAGALAFPLPGLSDVPRAEVAVSGSGADFALVGPMDTTNDLVYMSLLSGLAAAGGYEGFLQYQKTDGSNLAMLEWGYPGLAVPFCSGVTAVEPGTGTSATNPAAPESWHNLTWSGGGTFSGISRYRKMPDNSVRIHVDGAFASSGSPTATLPAGYQPANQAQWPMYGALRCTVAASTGALEIFSETGGDSIGFIQDVPLD